jgi:putative ABC transport system permease protein
MRLAVRTDGAPLALVPMLREALRELDPEIPLAEVSTMDAVITDSDTITQSRATTGALAIFAGIAVLLATVGLYGVLAYSVSQRSHEIGVRMALGARGGNVLGMVLGQGMLLVAVGLALGVLGAVAAGRLIEEQLFGIGSTDPLTYLGVCAVFAVVAAAACLVPSFRATRVDPLEALQAE